MGADNNYILNPDFSADRVTVTDLTGWTTTVDSDFSVRPFVSNTSPGANGSRFAAILTNPEAFSGSLSQQDEVPPGLYRLTATARSGGGLSYARIRVTGGKNETYELDLNLTTQGWEEFTLGHLSLTSGRVTVSIEARSQGGGQAVAIDSLSLVRKPD